MKERSHPTPQSHRVQQPQHEYVRIKQGGLCALSESRVDWPSLDITISNRSTRWCGLYISWDTRGRRTSTSGSTWSGLCRWVGGVEPEHIGIMIIPYWHNKRHTRAQRRAHRGKPAMGLEGVIISKRRLLSIAVCGGDWVSSDVSDGRLRVGDHSSALDIEAFDFGQWAADELRYNGEHLAGVNSHALAVESGVTLAVRVEVASIRIASTSVAGSGVGSSAGIALTHRLGDGTAGMRC